MRCGNSGSALQLWHSSGVLSLAVMFGPLHRSEWRDIRDAGFGRDLMSRHWSAPNATYASYASKQPYTRAQEAFWGW
jgi:hypothetical protein